MHDNDGSAAAPAARCRRFRRGSFILNPPSLAVLFDHLVGASEQAIGHRDTKSLRGLEIDDQLVFRRSLYRQVGRFLACRMSWSADCITSTQHSKGRVKCSVMLVAGFFAASSHILGTLWNQCSKFRCRKIIATGMDTRRWSGALNRTRDRRMFVQGALRFNLARREARSGAGPTD